METARRLGARVPTTLISNDFEEIAAFWRTRRCAVVKPYRTVSWKSGGEVFASFATRMPEPREDLRSSLELCPQIFQEAVDKVADVRLVAFGRHVFAVEVSAIEGIVDSRFVVNKRKGQFRRITPPAVICRFVDDYLNSLGLLYGAFDFAITPAGEWVFFECNESGQFLYLEALVPEMNVLDAFCRWFAGLVGKRSETGPWLKLADFDRSGDPRRPNDWSSHKAQLIVE